MSEEMSILPEFSESIFHCLYISLGSADSLSIVMDYEDIFFVLAYFLEMLCPGMDSVSLG
jgi:hypothetical protein